MKLAESENANSKTDIAEAIAKYKAQIEKFKSSGSVFKRVIS